MFTGQCQTVAASGDTAGAGLHFPDPARAQAGGGGGQAHAGIHETAAWTLPACRLAGTDAWAALDQPVDRLNPVGMPDCSIGLWVQIGDQSGPTQAAFDGAVVYRCPAPPRPKAPSRPRPAQWTTWSASAFGTGRR